MLPSSVQKFQNKQIISINNSSNELKCGKMSSDDEELLKKQDSKLVSQFKALKLEEEAKKNWDVFYKRNGDRFFKDRHWTTREFEELIPCTNDERTLLEIGCGTGNFIFPLLEDKLPFYIIACDFSPRAVDLVKSNKLYNENKVKAFVADITNPESMSCIQENSVDIITMIFVLSTVHPKHFDTVLTCLYSKLKHGGVILFRDYGLYDMAQLRFKPGHKIFDNFYMRQDGTRSYFFSTEVIKELFSKNKFHEIETTYINRRTINKKEGIDIPRIFVQARFNK